MANIQEHKDKITVFYSKRDGRIVNWVSGIQNMDFYGSNRDDFSLIRDYIVVTRDNHFINNTDKFIVNIDTKELEELIDSESERIALLQAKIELLQEENDKLRGESI